MQKLLNPQLFAQYKTTKPGNFNYQASYYSGLQILQCSKRHCKCRLALVSELAAELRAKVKVAEPA